MREAVRGQTGKRSREGAGSGGRLREFAALCPARWPVAIAVALSLLLVAGPLLTSARLAPTSNVFLPVHTILEFIAMAVSVMVFALGWNLRKQAASSHAVVLGVAALAVACIDMAHTLSFKGMPDFVTPSDPEKAINFWLAARLVAAVSLLVVAFSPSRRWSARQCWTALAASAGFAGVAWWIGLYHGAWLPRTFVGGEGLTSFKIGTEYGLALMFGVAAIALLRRAQAHHDISMTWLASAAWTFALGEMFFTLYQYVTDVFNLLGHIYKTLGYVMMYRAIFVAGVAAPYDRLQQSQRRLDNAMTATGEGLWDWDISGGVVYHNPRWYHLLGLEDAQLIHSLRHFGERIHPDDKRRVLAAISDCVQGGRPYYSEHRMRHADGHYLWVMDCGDVVERAPGGTALRMAGSFRDITELHEARLALEQYRDHLEEAVAARTRELEASRAEAHRLAATKSEFLANMSHEIRTPLNAVLGLARIGARDSADTPYRQTFARILDAGDHLLGVINDILDISKIEAGKLKIESKPFLLSSAIANARSFLSSGAQLKKLALRIDPAEDLPEWVNGDARRLQQILVNLLSNAVKFTDRGEIRLAVEREGDDILFRVQDSGIGIEHAALSKLFLPFEQADASRTRRYGGTGLGLAISQRLAGMMHGEIIAQSEPGKGSCFTLRIRLPEAEPVAALATVHAAAQSRRLVGLRVLAAEDVEVNRVILGDMLEHEGAVVVFAEDGLQAVECLRLEGADAFDLVLMDVQMPNMDGYQATRHIRDIAPRLAVLGLTAHALAEEGSRCIAAGMVEHVTKPIDPETLIEAILRHAGDFGSRATNATCVPVAPDPNVMPDPRQSPLTSALQASRQDDQQDIGLIDWKALLARFSGREAFVRKLVTTALTTHGEMPQKLRFAVRTDDMTMVTFLAHTVKGVAGNLGARTVSALAGETEVASKEGSAVAPRLAEELADAVDRMLAELEAKQA